MQLTTERQLAQSQLQTARAELTQSRLLDARCTELVNAVLSLYSTNTPTDSVIDAWYSSDCTFEDPLVCVSSNSSVKAQFRALRWLLRPSCCATLRHFGCSRSRDRKTIYIVSDMVFWPRYLPRCLASVRLPCMTTVLDLDSEDGKVVRHQDLWATQEVLRAVPIFGWLVLWSRWLLGFVTSILFRIFLSE